MIARDERRRFRAKLALEKLFELIRETALAVHPLTTPRLTQQEFDEHAPTIAAARGWYSPPSARAIYMRVNKRRLDKKPWPQIVAEACDPARDPVKTAAALDRAEPRSYHDERFVFYSLRRVAEHLGFTLGAPGPTPDVYERGYEELIELDHGLRRGNVLSDLLLTSGQIVNLAGPSGWAGACILAGYQPPARPEPVRGADPLKLYTHFYETKRCQPRNYRELTRHANALGIPLPSHQRVSFTQLREEFLAERSARGLSTPDDGPVAGTELDATSLEALLAGAPTKRPRGYWRDREKVIDALGEYVELFDSRRPLRQKHYLTIRAEHGWPALKAISHHGTFQALLDEARLRRMTTAQAA